MGLRVRRIARLLPGVRLNLSKSGASLSLGGRGLSVNLGRGGVRTTAGVPGSGLSYSTRAPWSGGGTARTLAFVAALVALAILAWFAFAA